MRGEVSGDLLLIGEVTDVRGTKVKVKVYSQRTRRASFTMASSCAASPLAGTSVCLAATTM